MVQAAPATSSAPSGLALWHRLKALRDEGLFDQVGVSAYASDDPAGLARRFKPDLLQAPASLLDQRLLLDGSLMAVREMGIEVHLRSIFLNGLLFLPPDRVPAQLKGAAGRRLSRGPPDDRRGDAPVRCRRRWGFALLCAARGRRGDRRRFDR